MLYPRFNSSVTCCVTKTKKESIPSLNISDELKFIIFILLSEGISFEMLISILKKIFPYIDEKDKTAIKACFSSFCSFEDICFCQKLSKYEKKQKIFSVLNCYVSLRTKQLLRTMTGIEDAKKKCEFMINKASAIKNADMATIIKMIGGERMGQIIPLMNMLGKK